MPYFLIKVQDIPEAGRQINASMEDDWFRKVVEETVSGDVGDVTANLSATVSKIEKTLEVTGGIYLGFRTACSRCATEFDYEQEIPFRFLLEPMPIPDKNGEIEDEEDMNESLDFSYYSGDEVDLGDLIRQYVLMSQPISYVCREECKGLCSKCGKNLNEGPCGCPEDHNDTPFAVLKGFKGR